MWDASNKNDNVDGNDDDDGKDDDDDRSSKKNGGSAKVSQPGDFPLGPPDPLYNVQ